MQNAEQLENAYDTLKDSAGSANKEQESYISSLSGKINALKESLTTISMQMIDSDMFKGLIDGATTGVQVTSKLIDFFGTFPSIVGIATASLITFNSRIRENTNSMLQAIPGYGKVTTSIKGWSDSISKNITQLQSQKAELKISQEKALAAGESTSALGKKMLGLNTNLGVLKVGLAATKVAVVALNAAMSMALTMGISAIISGLGSLIDKILLTRSELNELNQEFITTNSDSEMSNVIDLVNTYEELQNTLSTLKKGTSEYKDVEDKLASTQESILSIYPSASKAIENNTEAKRLNLEATKKLIDKDLELAKSDALNILEKNDTKTDTGLDKAIEQYQEYYKVLEKVNDLAEKEETKSVNIKSDLSDSGELLVNAKDVDTYKKRVESLNDTLEASYEAYKILGVSNDKYAEKAKKVGEALGYSASQTEELINKLKETDESADETADALEDINGDGIIDAADQMLKLAETTDEAKTAVQNLGDAFSQLESPIKMLETAIEEFKEYGMVSDDTWSDIITSGNSELIALLGDNENFLKNAEQLYGNLKTQQEELAQQTIRRAQEEVNASGQVVDGLNEELQALSDLENTKTNISTVGANERSNIEAQVVSNNSRHYALDEANHNNKENYKIKGSFASATDRMNAEKQVVDNNSKNYSVDSQNQANVENTKIKNTDTFANAAIQGVASMVTNNDKNYRTDANNFANATNSKLANIRALNDAVGASAGLLNEYKQLTAETKEASKVEQSILYGNNGANLKKPSVGVVSSSYVGSGGIGGGVSHGSLGSGSGSGNKGSSSSSSSKEVEDMESLVDRYHDLEDAINDVNNELETNKILQDGATGQQKIKLMEKEIQLYKKQQQAIKNLIAEQKKEAQELKNSLSSQGVSFNSAGDISNYNQILTSKVNWANSLSGDAKEKAIEQVKELEATMKSYDELVNKTIPSQEQEWESLNNIIKDVYKTQAELIADMEKNISETIEYELKKRYDAKKEALNKEKELYNKEYEEANFEEEMNTERNKLAEIQAEIDKVKNDTSRAGQLRLKQLLEEYEDQQKVINDKIKEQQNQAINDRFDEEEALLDKELEDMTSTENLSQMVAEAISTGMIKIGEETINVQNSMNDMLKETEVGFANVALQQSEWLSNLEQIKTLYSSINSIMSNAGMTTPSYDSISRSRSIGDISITTGGITITGNADNSTLGNIKDMLDAQAKEIYKNIAKQLS